jgi:hypothetical protein
MRSFLSFWSCVFCLFMANSFAYFNAENEGGAVFAWMGNLQSARTAALEGAGGAMRSNDAGAVLLNPAQLTGGTGYAASAAWQTGDLADMQGILAFAHPAGPFRMQHTYGVVSNGEVPHYNADGDATGVSSYPVAQTYSATLSFPLAWFDFGVSARGVFEKLADTQGSQVAIGLAMDWGILWRFKSQKYGLGFAARNFGAQVRSFVEGGSNNHPMAQEFALQGFWRPSGRGFAWMLELNAPRYSPVEARLGAEYMLGALAIRAGFRRNVVDLYEAAKSLFTSKSIPDATGTHHLFGVGAGYNGQIRGLQVSFDYSYNMLFEGMGAEHRLALGVGW